jgi:acyl-CoA reductase-like NAD-dependent aldehyde dehydrogenase
VFFELDRGERVLIRPIEPGDKEKLVNGLRQLSEDSTPRRFLAAKPRFTTAELRYLTEVDGVNHIALVAVLAKRAAGGGGGGPAGRAPPPPPPPAPPAAPRRAGRRARTTGQLRFFADIVAEGSYAEAVIDPADPDAGRPDVRRVLVPLGPVGVFGASNFPFAFSVAGGDTAAALAARCPVVYKAHPSHPGTDELAARALTAAVAEVGAPPGTFSLIQGTSNEVGEALTLAPEIRAIGFTGSLRAGRALHELGATRDEPIPVYAEMGSLNPVFVTRGALRDRGEEIAEGLVGSMTMGTGQFCTKPGLVFVPTGEAGDRFVAAVGDRLAERGDGPLLNERIRDAFTAQLAATSDLDGVEAVVAGASGDEGGFRCAPSLLTVDAATFTAEPALSEEHFGPVSIIVRHDPAEAVELAAGLDGSLTATIHAQPDEHDEVRALQATLAEVAGRIVHDGYPTGVAVTYAMHHGGPYPATTTDLHTSVGATAIRRFLRPVAFQDTPDDLLPEALRDDNPRGIVRLVDGALTRDAVTRGGGRR